MGWWPSGCQCAEGACCSIQCTRVCTPPFCLSHSGAVQLWWLAMALVQCNTKNQFRNTTSGPLGYPPPVCRCFNGRAVSACCSQYPAMPHLPTFTHLLITASGFGQWPMSLMPNAQLRCERHSRSRKEALTFVARLRRARFSSNSNEEKKSDKNGSTFYAQEQI